LLSETKIDFRDAEGKSTPVVHYESVSCSPS